MKVKKPDRPEVQNNYILRKRCATSCVNGAPFVSNLSLSKYVSNIHKNNNIFLLS